MLFAVEARFFVLWWSRALEIPARHNGFGGHRRSYDQSGVNEPGSITHDFQPYSIAGSSAIVEDEAVSVGRENEGDVQRFPILQPLLNAVADGNLEEIRVGDRMLSSVTAPANCWASSNKKVPTQVQRNQCLRHGL